ncbi:MAG: GFA family protein [Nevskia sp.]|nr:GFA family protein [Nevskia sp.]
MTAPMVHRGSCLCGGVRYEYSGGFGPFTLCHCSQCRKAQGSAFAAVLPIQAQGFRLVAGEALLKAYESSPGKERVFCGVCGSPLFSRLRALPGVLRLRAGSLDTPVEQAPAMHIFAASKASWDTIADGLPQHAERPAPQQ